MLGLLVAMAANPAMAKKEFDLSTIQTAAVVGFGGQNEIEENETRSGIGVVDTVNQLKQTAEAINGLEEGTLKQDAQSDAVRAYGAVESKLESGFGWSVLSRDELVAVPAYQQLDEARSTPGKLGEMGDAWGAGYCPSGVVHWASMIRVKQPERDALIEALGVDAVVVAQFTVSGKDQGVSIGGVGTSRIKPQALVQLSVYQKGEKKPVWRGYAQGPKVDEALQGDFGKTADPSEAILAALDLGMDKLTEKY
jgi:hypothetical protein